MVGFSSKTHAPSNASFRYVCCSIMGVPDMLKIIQAQTPSQDMHERHKLESIADLRGKSELEKSTLVVEVRLTFP